MVQEIVERQAVKPVQAPRPGPPDEDSSLVDQLKKELVDKVQLCFILTTALVTPICVLEEISNSEHQACTGSLLVFS